MKVLLLIFLAATTAKAMSIADPSSQREGQKCSNIPSWMERSLSTVVTVETKIVGGEDALEPIPWQAHITIMKGRQSFRCGGTILDERTILSAAHCFHPFEQVGPVRVETGILHNPYLERSVDIDAKTSNVQEIINHPNYDDSTHNNDIAILKLKTPLTITKDSIIQPACLPDPSLFLEDEELGVVSGWGRTTRRISSQVSDNLKYVSLPVLSNDACSNWTSLYKTLLTDNMFCAGFREGRKDSCSGDSGGPFIVNGGVNLAALGFERTSSSSSPAIIYGVVSFGPSLCGIPKVPGVYTLVTKYIPWITSHLKGEKLASCQHGCSKDPSNCPQEEESANLLDTNSEKAKDIRSAITHNNIEAVIQFLEEIKMKNPIIEIFGTEPKTDQISVLEYAAHYGKLEAYKNVSAKLTNLNPKAASGVNKGVTPLHRAAGQGHLDLVKFIAACQEDINPAEDDGFTVMHWAAQSGSVSVIKWYLDNLEGDKNPPRKTIDKFNGRTPLHDAASRGQLEVVKAISKVIKQKNPGDSHKGTPFHLASEYGHLQILQYMIDFVPDIDIRTDEYWDNNTPLHRASIFGKLEIVKYLIEKGADPKLKSKSDKTAYDYAVENGKSEIEEYLKQFN